MPAGERRAWTVRLPGRSPRARMSAENDVAESRWDTFALATKVPDPGPTNQPGLRDQLVDHPAQRHPGHPELLGEPALGGQQVTGGQPLDQQLQLLADLLLLRGRRARLYGGHRRTTTCDGRLSR